MGGNFETGRREHQHQRREVRTTTLLFAQRCVPPHPLASQASALKAVTRTHLPPAAVFLIVDDRIWPPGQPCRRSSAYSRHSWHLLSLPWACTLRFTLSSCQCTSDIARATHNISLYTRRTRSRRSPRPPQVYVPASSRPSFSS